MGYPIDILKGVKTWITNIFGPHGMLLSGHDNVPPMFPFRNEECTPPTAASQCRGCLWWIELPYPMPCCLLEVALSSDWSTWGCKVFPPTPPAITLTKANSEWPFQLQCGVGLDYHWEHDSPASPSAQSCFCLLPRCWYQEHPLIHI